MDIITAVLARKMSASQFITFSTTIPIDGNVVTFTEEESAQIDSMTSNPAMVKVTIPYGETTMMILGPSSASVVGEQKFIVVNAFFGEYGPGKVVFVKTGGMWIATARPDTGYVESGSVQ